MTERFNPENWREGDDPILDLETEKGRTVKDHLQDLRDEHAHALRSMRATRDQKREESEQYKEEANKPVNRILRFIRRDGHESNPDVLGEKSKQAEASADRLQKDALYRKDVMAHARKENAPNVVDDAIAKTMYSLESLYSQGFFVDGPDSFILSLDAMPRDEIMKVIESDYRSKYREEDVTTQVFKRLYNIKEELVREPFKMGRAIKKYDDFVKGILFEEARDNEEVFKKTESILPLLGCINSSTPPEEREMIMKAVDKNLTPEIIESVIYKANGLKALEQLVSLKSEVVTRILREKIESSVDSIANPQAGDLIFSLVVWYRERPLLTKLVSETIGECLEKEFGISDGKYMVPRWSGAVSVDVHSNLMTMRVIEKKVPGAVKLLHEEYGINEFKRYPVEMLIDQAKAHNQDVPYGLALFPEEDHNDAFDQDTAVLKQLYDGTKGKHLTRVFEISKESSLMRYLVSLRLKYEEKIAYLILAGHGEESRMEFSWKSRLDKTILEKSTSIGAIKDMFVEEPSIALFSCSTGVEEGLGQLLSEKLGARVQAPKVPTGPGSLEVRYKGDKPMLEVTYRASKKNDKAEYLKGTRE